MNEIKRLADYFQVDICDAMSVKDKRYCERQQQAYESALAGYQKLYNLRNDMETQQDECLGTRNVYTYEYLSTKYVQWDEFNIAHAIARIHKVFICKIAKYFHDEHDISFDMKELFNALLPEKPRKNFSWRRRRESFEQEDKYLDEMFQLKLHYRGVVEEIVWQLNGQNFNDEAVHALQTECYMASWTKPRLVPCENGEMVKYPAEPKFRKKNQTIRFENACFYDEDDNCYRLNASFCSIIKGLAYYETKSFTNIPMELYDLLHSFDAIQTNIVKLFDCDKSLFIKFFKNGNVDLKFWSPEFAQDFAEDYLGLQEELKSPF